MEQTDIQRKIYDVAVIGGGAAGLMAAGRAAKNGYSVLLIEKMEKGGRKVRISGKGRCNVTNMRSEEECLAKIRGDVEFFRPALRNFNNKAVFRFFERMGVKLAVEQGDRVFPKSGNAWDIADALVYWCRDNGVEIWFHTKVERILTVGGQVYGVEYTNRRGFRRKVDARNVIIATGGASYPLTGSTGDGYAMANALGHTIVEVRPALVPLKTSHPDIKLLEKTFLKNISATLVIDGEPAATEFGELSISPRGVEGAVTLRMSGQAVDALIDGRKVEMLIDIKPALTEQQICDRLKREIAQLPEDAFFGDLLRKVLPRPMVAVIARSIGIETRRYVSRLTDDDLLAAAHAMKSFELPISDYCPFENAIVTAGGVSTDEVDAQSMESKKVKGLYLAGEVLDLDASTGGYNLQIAFSTGYLAGELKGYEK